jgi:hypothetical protein
LCYIRDEYNIVNLSGEPMLYWLLS